MVVTVSATSVKLAVKSAKSLDYRVRNEVRHECSRTVGGKGKKKGDERECFTRDWIVIRDRNAIRGWFFFARARRMKERERENHRRKNKAEEPAALSDV
ncbi:hypothetical protein K0M31_020338, partial [Melipona bicolor]